MIRRPFALLLPLALLLAGCQDHPLPTALAPEGAAFDHQSGSCEVSNTQDSGEGSLRHAIETAACTTITFSLSLPATIALTSGQLTISRDLTITGPGATSLTVSGNNASRVFSIAGGTTVSMSGLTVSGGRARGVSGGGIYNEGTLALVNITVSGNTADGEGGGIRNEATLTLTNSTVSGNTAIFNGGGISNWGTLTLTHSTVSGNTGWYLAANGGGIFNWGTLTLHSSLVAGNTAGFGRDVRHRSGIAMASYSLIGSGDGHSISNGSDGNLVGVNPLLGLLADNGGPTKTHALLEGSPAIDHIPPGTNGCGTTIARDQRGITRPQGSGCDIGAFELEQASAPAFGGFRPPVREGQLNVMKAGSAVPIKFSLGGDFGLQIFADGYPTSVPIDCPTAGIARNSVSGTSSARASRLTYDAEDDQYNYLWATQKGWAGTCRQFQMQLSDGSPYSLDFSFTR